ncbi:hypothetical protein B0A52_02475 [Exophiala mesophila]|uniref:3-hydroxyisobutyrate dehydrogenase n=1 Tax=Exophiala mesophila TaxID=212818 RepID=A0A438NCT5_EXOME|nr:hypothetical protein B0A52_02475 [Exophiala mesophila]
MVILLPPDSATDGQGVGKMGFHMAANVRKKMPSSSTLYVFDVNTEACRRFQTNFASHGPIEIANAAKDLASQSSTVISMVPMDEHARAVYLDPENGVIAASKDPNRLLLECSTINVTTTQDIGRKVFDAGVGTYVDTPVSGGVRGAEAGTLSFFLGYKATDNGDHFSKRILSVVEWMGAADKINFCGDLGLGLVCKITNNYIGLTNIVVAAEGLAFGLRHGVDKGILYKCIKASSGDSWALTFSNPVPGIIPESASSNGFKAGFTSRLCAKDLGLALQAAREVGIRPKMGEISLKYYEEADKDPSTTGLDGSSVWLHINDEAADFVRLE